MGFILFLISVVVAFIVLVGFLPSYLTHISMNRDDNPKVIRMTTYSRFITLVNAFPYWEQQDRHPKSMFGDDKYYNGWYVHADIVRLNGDHFIFWPHSYVAFKIWESRLGKKNSYKFYWR